MNQKAYTLIEMLIAVSIFAVLGIVVTQTIAATLRSTGKSEATLFVKENLDLAASTIERAVRLGTNVSCGGSVGDGNSWVAFTDQSGTATSFGCDPTNDAVGVGQAPSVTRITNTSVVVDTCSFTCSPASPATPTSITFSLGAHDAKRTGAEGAIVTLSKTVVLRNR